MLAVTIPLHATWNFGLPEPPFILKIVPGVPARALAFGLLQSGLQQIQAAQGRAITGAPPGSVTPDRQSRGW